MMSFRHGQIAVVSGRLACGLGLAAATAACTPATVEPELAAAGTAGEVSSSAGASMSAAGGPSGSGGSGGSDSGASATAGSSGAVASGGASGAAGSPASGGSGAADSGGSASTAGSSGTSGSGGGGGAAATGCNWVHAADDTWSMNPAAADKVVLFDGKDLSQWHRLNQPNTPAQWKVLSDGTMQVVPQATPTNIQSNMKFDDVCLHVEYMTPIFPSNATVQQQGNSGVFLKSAYEMQVLDTHDSPPLIDGCGAVYKVSPPLVVACHMYLVWNTYEIEFKSSGWDTSVPPKKIKNAVFAQSVLNSQLVQKNVTLNPAAGFTEAGIPDAPGPQPIALQDHRDLVSFRNIWVTIPHY